MRTALLSLAVGAVIFLGQFSEDLGLFGHAVWIHDPKSDWRWLCYVGIWAIVLGTYHVGRHDGRR